jgi:hypothetical protein
VLQALSNVAVDERPRDQPVADSDGAAAPSEGWFGTASLVLAALSEG